MFFRIWISMRRVVSVILEALFSSFGVAFISYFYKERIGVYRLVKKIRDETDTLAKCHELYQIYVTVRSTEKIAGDLAEVGVYKGTTAKVICEAKGQRRLHLFDTFTGLPEPSEFDRQFYRGQYSAQVSEVREYLKKYSGVHIYQGLFPQATGKYIRDRRFSFVHLDVDLYLSTKDSLVFFYPRMTKGGVILSHDFVSPGVKWAFTEFFADKPEVVLELPGIQCLVVKV